MKINDDESIASNGNPIENNHLRFILTCGGKLPRGFPQETADNAKVLLKVQNKSLLESALIALNNVHSIKVVDSVAVGSSAIESELTRFLETTETSFDLFFATEGASLLENLQIGINTLNKTNMSAGDNPTSTFHGQNDMFAVLSPDLPFIDADALDDFLSRIPVDAEVAMPIVSKEAFTSRYPKSHNRFNKFIEGSITLGSIVLVRGSVINKNSGLFQDAHNSRKNVCKLAGMLGISIIIKLLVGRLSIHEVEDRISQLVDARVHAVLDCDPALAYDIDNAENLKYAQNYPFNH